MNNYSIATGVIAIAVFAITSISLVRAENSADSTIQPSGKKTFSKPPVDELRTKLTSEQ